MNDKEGGIVREEEKIMENNEKEITTKKQTKSSGTRKTPVKKKVPVQAVETVDETKVPAVAAEQTAAEVAAEAVCVKEKKKILFVASEAAPFIATGGLAEVVGSLSKALAATGNYDVRVIIPMYSDIRPQYRQEFQFIGSIFIPLAWRNQYCGIFPMKRTA